MSLEEIRALAAELGLDPKALKLFEPWPMKWGGREYRFQYSTAENVWQYMFCLGNEDIGNGYEAVAVKVYVDKGLRQLAEKVNPCQ